MTISNRTKIGILLLVILLIGLIPMIAAPAGNEPESFVKIVPALEHSAAIKSDGTLWTWGINKLGALGLGDNEDRDSPTKVGKDTDWADVACGSWGSTVALKTNGSLWAWGNNNSSQLGLGNRITITSPTRVGTDTDWTRISCGEIFSMALKKDGTLWAWGRRDLCGLGLPITGCQSSPTKVGTDADWAVIDCGHYHTIARKTDGSWWAWGDNQAGQLGLGDYKNRFVPTKIAVAADWAMIACGGSHTIALKPAATGGTNPPRQGNGKTGNTLWAWGDNFVGQLGQGYSAVGGGIVDYKRMPESKIPFPTQIGNDTNWAKIDTKNIHNIALKTDGTMWGWGTNMSQLGLGELGAATVNSPTQIGKETDWTDFVCGDYETLAIKADRSLWWFGTGCNEKGQLGINKRKFSCNRPVRVIGFVMR